MKKIVFLLMVCSNSVLAQIVTTEQVYQEPRLSNVVPNPFPPSYYQERMRRYNFQKSPRVIISTTRQIVIPTGPVSVQDRQIINLIK